MHKKNVTRTLLMGIINVTPDSFSGDGIVSSNRGVVDCALRLGLKHIRDGADILDIGGESTRPGALKISVKEEIKRVIPVIKALRSKVKQTISLDSYEPEVIHAALDAGVDMVNVIKGCPVSLRILKLVSRYQASIVLMHMRGTPQTMQQKTHYKNLLKDIYEELKYSIEKCLAQGITKDKIIIDPGIGLPKTVDQNLLLIKELSFFKRLQCSLLVGPSRKSFIGKVLGLEPKQRLLGTSAVVASCVLKGANIVRVHDVRQMRQVVDMINAIEQS